MKLLRNYMKTCLKTAEKNRMCVRVIGDKSRLDEDIRNRIDELEKAMEIFCVATKLAAVNKILENM